MTNWKIDDKEWMKQRKEEWKAIKPKVGKIFHLKNEEKRSVKDFYFKGEEYPDYPLKFMMGGALWELWLHPDSSEKNWQSIKERCTNRQWSDARTCFLDINKLIDDYCPNGESFFSGLEKRLCYFLNFDRLRREDEPSHTDDSFLMMAKRQMSLVRSFDGYLRSENPHPYKMVRWQVQRWRDALLLAYDGDIHGFDWMINALDRVLAVPDQHHPLAVELAQELATVLVDPALPEAAKEYIADIRAGGARSKVNGVVVRV